MRNCLHSLQGGACFSKFLKLCGLISGATISFIASQRRGSKPSSFTIFFFFFFVKNMLKDQLFKTSRLKFDTRFFEREKFSGLSTNKPQVPTAREESFLENMTEVPKKARTIGKVA